MFDMGWRGTAGMSLMFVVNLMLSPGYVGKLVTLCLAPGTRRFVAIFAPAGRMALSNTAEQQHRGIRGIDVTGIALFARVDDRGARVVIQKAITWIADGPGGKFSKRPTI